MPDAMIVIPLAALVAPGLLAYGMGRAMQSIWPGAILGLASLGSAIYFLSAAQGAAWNDGAALNSLFAAFGISLPALISSAIGGTLAHVRVR